MTQFSLRRLGAIAVLLSLSGCSTQLNVIRINDAGTNIPPAAAPYNLTFTKYKLNVTRRIHSCVKESAVKNPDGTPKWLDDVVVKIDITASKSEARDPSHTYAIDMLSLHSFFKSSDVKVTYYDSGALKTVNAEAEDKTGEFAASAATTVSKLLVGLAKSGRDKSVVACLDKVADAVRLLPVKEKELVALTEQIASTTEQVKHYTALAVAAGRGMSQADREELSRRVAKLVKQQEAHEAVKKEVAQYLKLISVVDEKSWPDDGDTFESTQPALAQLSDEVLKKWIGGPNPHFASNTALYLKLQPEEPIAKSGPCTGNCAENFGPGLKYRMPALGSLMMCHKNKVGTPANAFECEQWEAVAAPELISQLGRIFILPLKSTLFSKKTISASFSEAGVPTLLGAGASAASDKAAATLGGIADAVIAGRASRTAAENTELEAKIKNIQLQKDYLAAIGPKLPPADTSKQDETALFSVDTALINAEVANIEARKTLAALKNL